jgi:hypothetical protein
MNLDPYFGWILPLLNKNETTGKTWMNLNYAELKKPDNLKEYILYNSIYIILQKMQTNL